MKKATATRLVMDELIRAEDQHDSFASPHEGFAVLKEEVDELWDEVKGGEGTTHRGVSEAVQTAAMALRYLIDLCDEKTAKQHEQKVEGIGEFAPSKTRTWENTYGGYSG